MKTSAKRFLGIFISLILFVNPVLLRPIQAQAASDFNPVGRQLVQSNLAYIVDRLTDANPSGGGEGSGLTGDLRYAIINAQSGDNITINVTGTISLSSALPTLTRNISIQGNHNLTVRGSGGNVFSVGNSANVVLSNLTITGGIGNGGGVFNQGTLTLNNVTVSGNRAGDPTNGGGTGAGIWNYSSGTLILNNSTISDNRVLGASFYNPSRGGGIANYGTLTLNNSTVSGNNASEGSGGGISNTLASSKLTLNNSTVSGNSATGVSGIGSGINNRGTLHMTNTIIGGNLHDDLRGVVTSLGHNLISNATGASGLRPDLGDLLDISPLLDSLKDNGGSTQTHALLTGSPAIDQGDNAACLSTDQRGVSRPQDGNQDGTTNCDIGAYELGNAFNPRPIATPGIHDDGDPAWNYSGNWATYTGGGPYNNSLHYTSTIGDAAELTFSGTKFTLFFTRDFNRGSIAVYLDNSVTPLTTIDAYAGSLVFQQSYTSPILTTGTHTVRLVHAGGRSYIDIDAIRVYGPSGAVPAGMYDDADPAWNYSGSWATYTGGGPYNNSLHYTSTIGDTAELTFSGTKFTLFFTRDFNRGSIAVYVDGAANPIATIDAYSASLVFQQSWSLPAPLSNGTHTLEFRKPSADTAVYIDIDAITIE